MPLSTKTLTRLGVPAEKARAHLPHLAAAMRRFDITTQRRAECFLAQLFHESGTLQFFEEIASGDAYEGRKDLGNTQPGDGRRYKGRGPIQLTGRTNYRAAGAALGVDFEARPKLVATPRYGYLVAAWFWSSRGLNALADENRFEDITRRINGAATWGAPSHHARRVDLRKRIAAHDVRPGQDAIARGATGDAVQTLTRRLSFVRSATTGEPYLDGARRKFDRETELSLERFQHDHELRVDGEYGPKTRKALARAVERRKRQRARRPAEPAAPSKRPPAKRPGTRPLARLIAQLDQLDARHDDALRVVLRRGARLERLVAEAEEQNRMPAPAALRELDAELGRLDAMIGEVRGTIARATRAPAAAVTVTVAEPETYANVAEPETDTNGGTPANGGDEPAFAEIAARLVEHDARGDALRAGLAERLIELEARARELAPRRPRRVPEPPRPERPRPERPRPERPRPERPKRAPERGTTFRVTTPPMKSAEIAAVQRQVNRRLAAWKVELRVGVDGKYGPRTRFAARSVLFGMGVARKELEGGLTPELRELLRDPKRRTADERARARRRRRWIVRLRRRYDGNGGAAANGHKSTAWGGSRAVTDEVVAIVNGRAPVTSRKRAATDPLSKSNPGSDHNAANVLADAVDFGTANNHALKNEISRKLGGPATLADYGSFVIRRNGHRYRVQIIAGTHGTGPHLHVGVCRQG